MNRTGWTFEKFKPFKSFKTIRTLIGRLEQLESDAVGVLLVCGKFKWSV